MKMGENMISNLMKKMKNNSPLHPICPDKKLTNHSTRKTLAKKLQKNVIQSTELISITGLHYSPLQPCKRLPESNTATVSHIRLFTPSTLPNKSPSVASKSGVAPVSSSGRPGTVQRRSYFGALQVSPMQHKT